MFSTSTQGGAPYDGTYSGGAYNAGSSSVSRTGVPGGGGAAFGGLAGGGGAAFGGGAGGAGAAGCCAPGGAGGVGMCGAGADGCGTGMCGSNVAGGNLVWVGDGAGDFVQETTYKYVGAGRGNLAGEVRVSRCWIPCLACLLLAAIVLAIILWPTPGSTTSRKNVTLQVREKTCLFWGDPHVITFDGARPSFYGDGEFYIMKSPDVSIQGRYMGTKYTFGLAATQKIAIGGSFLNGHTIEVEPMEKAYGGRILVDGKEVLQSFGTFQVMEGATVLYNGEGELVDEATSQWTTHAVHLTMPKGIKMDIFRWGNYLDMKLSVRPESVWGGVDGACGDADGSPDNDTPKQIFERLGARVPDDELLFQSRAVVVMSPEETKMIKEECPRTEVSAARAACTQELFEGASEIQIKACTFDYCFGMVEHALLKAKKFASQEDLKAAHLKDFD